MTINLDSRTIGLVTVTFFPDEGFVKRIEALSASVGGCIVIDNRSDEAAVNRLKQWRDQSGQDLFLNDKNRGLAHALNQSMRRAMERGFQWALLMDQDSIIDPQFAQWYEKVFEQFKLEDIAVIGNNYGVQAGEETIYLLPSAEQAAPYIPCKAVITAGSLVSLKSYADIGSFREDFFIDWIDTEYCFRARRMGRQVVMVTHPVVLQKLGGTTTVRSPLGEAHPSHHSPMRRYFMMRNLTLLAKAYFAREPGWFISYTWEVMKIAAKILLFEQDKASKIGHMALGLYDGLLEPAQAYGRIRRMLSP
jgi:rhamnosyltransferase